MKKTQIGMLFCICFTIFTLFSQGVVGAQSDAVSFSLQRDFGTGFGDKMEGQFTLHGTGKSFIIKLELYFNDTLKSSADGNDLKYSFETKDSVGIINITLKGIDANGIWYSYSNIYEFLSPDINFFTVPLVVGIVVLALGIRLARYRKSKKYSRPKDPESMKKEINLSLDKDLL